MAASSGLDFCTNNSHTNSSEATRPMSGLSNRRTGSGVPKFKSLPPPSLPISQSGVPSPSSWFPIPPGLSPAELLDSPILLSGTNVLPSPTTGSFPVGNFDWKSSSDRLKQQSDTQNESHRNSFSGFNFPAQKKEQLPATTYGSSMLWDYHQVQVSSNNKVEEQSSEHKHDFNSSSDQGFSPEIAAITGEYNNNNNNNASNRKLDDGYNWRKYGQKQVKGSENPRSYYKCTYPNCPTKKKVERSIDGPITEIVYKGNHNHPKPQSIRRSSASSSSYSHFADISDTQSYSSITIPKMDSLTSVITSDNTSVLPDDDFEQSRSGGDELDNEERDAKRWKSEVETEGNSSVGGGSSKAVREPRVVVQTTSDIDILDDGFRWRKYGQKVVKGNPNPRSYYKCTTNGCPVRKHVERSSQDQRAVITTYEGKHNHDVPAARGSGSHLVTRPLPYNPYNGNLGMGNGGSMLLSDNSKAQASYSPEMIRGMPKSEPRDDDFMDSLLC